MLQSMLDRVSIYLLSVGDGVEHQYPPDHPLYPGWIHAPVNLASSYDDEMDFIKRVYEDYRQMTTIEEKKTFLRSTAILCPKNATADMIDEALISSDILGDDFVIFRKQNCLQPLTLLWIRSPGIIILKFFWIATSNPGSHPTKKFCK